MTRRLHRDGTAPGESAPVVIEDAPWFQRLLLEREEHVIELKKKIRNYERRLGISSERISENLRQEIFRRTEAVEDKDHLRRTRYVLLSLLEDLDIARRDLLRANERFRELDRMKSEFIRTASHELRTPIAAIKGATENLRDGLLGEMPPAQRDSVEIALRNANRLSSLVGRLLDFSRIESGAWRIDRRRYDLRRTVQEVVAAMTEARRGSPIRIETVLPEAPVEAAADKESMEQVLTNLVVNALRHARNAVVVRVETVGEEDARFTVEDDGEGVPEEEIDRIFHPFVRASQSDSRSGAGLGLSIARGIVEAHQGFIWCENRSPDEGGGARFVFVIPRIARDKDRESR